MYYCTSNVVCIISVILLHRAVMEQGQPCACTQIDSSTRTSAFNRLIRHIPTRHRGGGPLAVLPLRV